MRVIGWVLGGLVALAVLAAGGLYVYAVGSACTLAPVAALDLPEAVPVTPANDEDWRARTINDLIAARQALVDNTPIPFDTENPHYRAWLVTGFAQAMDRAQHVTDFGGYLATLLAFGTGFQDPHIALSPTGALPDLRWPGFIVTRTGDVAEVVLSDETDPAAPPVGARILSCDGQPLTELLRERIHPYRFIASLPRHQRAAMSRLFLDWQNPFVALPSSCRIVVADAERDVTLRWRALPADDAAWWSDYQDAVTGPPAPWGVSEPAPGVFWIGVPTFGSGDETSPRLEALIRDVAAQGEAMRQARAIIIDTRGNGGGNSAWAYRLAEAIFTPEVLAAHDAPSGRSAVDWRGSAENAAYWSTWAGRMRQEFGPFSIQTLHALFTSWHLSRVADAAPPLWRQGDCEPQPAGGLTLTRPRGAGPFPARVFFLSDGSCASSCLNFADRVLMVPGVTLIGSATSGDGPYMEVRDIVLPSGFARITLPQKVYRGMGRGALETYAADIAYTGVWSDAAVRAWVMDLATAGPTTPPQ